MPVSTAPGPGSVCAGITTITPWSSACAEGLPQVGGGDPPCVRREVNERVDQRPAGALRDEIADEAVRVHAVGGAKIGHAEHGFARQLPRGGHHGRVDRLEGGALREGVPRVVVRHARELGST